MLFMLKIWMKFRAFSYKIIFFWLLELSILDYTISPSSWLLCSAFGNISSTDLDICVILYSEYFHWSQRKILAFYRIRHIHKPLQVCGLDPWDDFQLQLDHWSQSGVFVFYISQIIYHEYIRFVICIMNNSVGCSLSVHL